MDAADTTELQLEIEPRCAGQTARSYSCLVPANTTRREEREVALVMVWWRWRWRFVGRWGWLAGCCPLSSVRVSCLPGVSDCVLAVVAAS